MTITEFLEARIAEDERAVEVAREYATKQMGGNPSTPAIFIGESDGTKLWSSDQILAECEAKRAIIAAFDPETPDLDPYVGKDVIAILATVYADHPDYEQEWAL